MSTIKELNELALQEHIAYIASSMEYEAEPHTTQKVNVHGEIVDVDVGMVPIVNWINDLGGRTLFCCQGNPQPPYVLFRANELALTQVMARIGEYHEYIRSQNISPAVLFSHQMIVGEVDWLGGLRFKLQWFDPHSLYSFTSWLSSKIS
jgi:hypothetical protein